jgi:hypothetical protein
MKSINGSMCIVMQQVLCHCLAAFYMLQSTAVISIVVILLIVYLFEMSPLCAVSSVLFFYVQQKLCTSP